MDLDAALEWLDRLVLTQTGDRLSELQRVILEQVWQGRTYIDIADRYGCTEGHAKDVGSDLWKLLSQVLGDRISKKNFRVTLPRHFQGLSTPSKIETTPEAPNFVGRTEAIEHLNILGKQGAKVIVIQGEGGLGKTTLAQNYLQTQGFEIVLELLMAKETQTITPAERIVEEWLKHDFQEEPGLEFGITLERLKRHLRRRRVGVLIDNLEPALNVQGQLPPDCRNYVELLRILSDPQAQGVTLVTSRDRLCEPAITAQHYCLPGLHLSAWQQFFEQQSIVLHRPTLKAMHHAYGGNAKAMGILFGAICEDYGGEMEPYWYQSRSELLSSIDLKNLVDSQINRLQTLDSQAYQLFCRLGCYRYQDVPTVPIQGVLTQLWDSPTSQQRSTLTALQNRSLIESHKGEYSLHPVLREAAIARLRSGADWMLANTQAAQFWNTQVTAIQTVQDALGALEAYYHHLAIQDYSKAGRVILKSRLNQWNQHLSLGSTLYRMGLVQPLLTAIPAIVEHLQGDYTLSELSNILGDTYWITGQVHRAIACQEQAIQQTIQAQVAIQNGSEAEQSAYYLKMLEIDSLLSIGLYKVDLWELEEAAALFESVIAQSANTTHARWAEKAIVCLAMVKSYLGEHQSAIQHADSILQTTLKNKPFENRGSFAYFMQLLAQTYTNLGQFETAQELYQKALSFSTTSHFNQVKACCLMGLAEIDREQERFTEALAKHQDSIALLEQIGAVCDLAEAYVQCGITQQKQLQKTSSEKFFTKAIHLFSKINAPRQLERITSLT
jgi:tetratricopeptide (TPR) repeat protein